MPSSHDLFLHIGSMKSGTSYLQTILRRNKSILAESGIFYPEHMVAIASDALGNRGKNRTMNIQGEWQRFLTQVGSWSGHAVIASHEFFGSANAVQATKIGHDLADRKVKIIITARDLARVIPSHWQTVVKGAKTWTFAEYVRFVLGETDSGPATRVQAAFWRHHDIPNVVRIWQDAMGPENVVLVTVPPSGADPDVLWTRFASVVGLEPEEFDHEPDFKSNVSLSYTETEMLRQVNLLIGKQLAPPQYRAVVNNYFANRLLRSAPRGEDDPDDRPALGLALHAKVSDRADQIVQELEATGVNVVGTLDDLRVGAFSGNPEVDESSGPLHPVPPVVPYLISQLLLKLAESGSLLADPG